MAKNREPVKAVEPAPDSEDEEEEGSDEEEEESDGPHSKVKPIALKPMPELLKSVSDSPKSNNAGRTARSKPRGSEPVSPTKSTAGKRPAENKSGEKESKKSKKTDESDMKSILAGDDSKKQLFQRLWSQDDEIVILKGIIDYEAKKKVSPIVDIADFLEFIKKDLHVVVTKTQLQDKIRRLKKRYKTVKGKEKRGKDTNFSKEHDQQLYELSKMIWSNDNEKDNKLEKVFDESDAKRSPKKNLFAKGAEKGEPFLRRTENFIDDVGSSLERKMLSNKGMNVDERILKIGAELFEGENAAEGASQWRKLCLEELQLTVKLLDLKRARTKLALDVIKSEL